MSYLVFDEQYYLQQNPDVSAAIQRGSISSGWEHFQQYGWREGRDPNDVFDISYYLSTYADVARAGVNPLQHYLSFGAGEGRLFNQVAEDLLSSGGRLPLVTNFDATAYLEANSDVAIAVHDGHFTSAFEHFALYGQFEMRSGKMDREGNIISGPIFAEEPDYEEPDYEVGTVTWSATVNDPTGLFGHMTDLLIRNAVLAGQQWTHWINSDVNIEVEIVIGSTEPGVLATGGSVMWTFLAGLEDADIRADGALYELVTGIDSTPDGHDILITLDADYLATVGHLSSDPLSAHYQVPDGMFDYFGLMMHEIGHGLGINGWLASGGDGSVLSPFDALTVQRGGMLYFAGEMAVAVYDGLVPLTLGNSAHYGNHSGLPGDDLSLDVMTGTGLYDGTVYELSDLDFAILADLYNFTSDYYTMA